MTERLLHFIWQFQYFSKGDLTTTDGEMVQVLFAGQYNSNQGPDFSDAKIRIDETTWAGTVELHLKTTDWTKHNHQLDKNYNNVILHVVWEDDDGRKPTDSGYVPDKSLEPYMVLPILELKNRVPKILLRRYEEWMNTGFFIPCEKTIHTVREITWNGWKDRLLIERLLRKARIIENYLEPNKHHWEEIFWWVLARNFGMKVNADAFEAMAKSVPISVLAKHKNQLHQVEALLLGQAGLLEGKFTDDYPVMLQKEYKFYKSKYHLKPTNSTVFFLRMRPGNFPTIRLAQLAMLVHQSTHLFSKIKEANSIKELKEWFDVTANDYWHYHYRFDAISPFKKKVLGAAMIDSSIINTVVPFLFAYGTYHNEHIYKEKALKWLENSTAENNRITKRFQKLGVKNKTAFDSQALLELKNMYCNTKRCLECGVGYALLKT